MKLGLGLYRHMLTRDNFRFARQAGATHIVVHLVDYFRGGAGHSATDDQPLGNDWGWGLAGDPEKLWAVEEMVAIRRAIEAEGLTLEAIENFDPAHWHDVLLDGPKRAQHIENVRTIIRRVGEAGIPIIGYNFSIAGVSGRTKGDYARGGAVSVGMEGPYDRPMPNGLAWNMVVDPTAPGRDTGTIPPATHEQLWSRFERFLNDVLPVAEEAGVRLALHPDDPPMPTMRGQPRLVYQPELYRRVVELNPSKANQFEFCVGTLGEMISQDAGDAYAFVDEYSRAQRVAYVHLRNVRGKVPHYTETFIDDGDLDALRVLAILRRNGFDGVIVPDHTPQMSCAAPWHAGMAFALGFLKAGLKAVEAT
jgi:mannonate dehydratase